MYFKFTPQRNEGYKLRIPCETTKMVAAYSFSSYGNILCVILRNVSNPCSDLCIVIV